MKEKTPQELAAAEKQAELLASALEKASDGYWLNHKGKMQPRIYPKGAPLSPFNAVIFGLHSDAHGYSTNAYLSFADAARLKHNVLKGERSVPMLWYNWSKMVNRYDDKDLIPREEWEKMGAEEKAKYKSYRQREVRHMFNLEQTALPFNDPEEMRDMQQNWGGINDRGNVSKEEKQARSTVNAFVAAIKQNLVPVRKAVDGECRYDREKDAVYMSEQKHFATYPEYVQELMRKVVEATGHGERLARQAAMVKQGREVPASVARHEQLVQELASGYKMMELGLPARIKPENMELVPGMIAEIRNNPCLMDALEADVNSALDMIRKAEKGQKLEFASERNARETTVLREGERSQVSCDDALVFQDIVRHGGMKFDERNFPKVEEQMNDFLARYTNLSYYRDQVNLGWWQATKNQTEPEMIEAAFTVALSEGSRLHQAASELIPREWEQNGTYEIADKLAEMPEECSQTIVVVMDKETGIADVILPSQARSGGSVVTKSGDRRNYWITPDEVMSREERKAEGAKIQRINPFKISKDRIEASLTDNGATYVRFYEPEGQLKFRPNDQWFAGKQIQLMQAKGKELVKKGDIDIADALKSAKEVSFDRISMFKDEDGRWTLLLKETGQPSFGVYPDRSDLNRFFSVMKTGDEPQRNIVRNELAQKYHALAAKGSIEKIDLFGAPSKDAVSMIERVRFYKTKEDKLMCAVQLKGGQNPAPKEITLAQWRKLWMADDVNQYKAILGSIVFADAIKAAAEKGPSVEGSQDNVEGSQDNKVEPKTLVAYKNGEPVEYVAGEEPWLKTEIAFPSLSQVDMMNLALWSAYRDEGSANLGIYLYPSGDVVQAYGVDAAKLSKALDLPIREEDGKKVASYPVKDHWDLMKRLIWSERSVVVMTNGEPQLFGYNFASRSANKEEAQAEAVGFKR